MRTIWGVLVLLTFVACSGSSATSSTGTPHASASATKPYLQSPWMREVTLSQTRSWWPWPTILHGAKTAKGGEDKLIIIGGYQRTLDANKCDFATMYCSLLDVLEIKPKTVDRYSQFALVDGGAIFVLAQSIPPGLAPPTKPSSTDKHVEVRGFDGWMHESYRRAISRVERATHGWRVGKSDRDMRSIQWLETVASGRTVQWVVVNSSTRYSEKETIEYVNAMKKVAGERPT